MVSPQRIKAKLQRQHSKIMAYEEVLTTEKNPSNRDILKKPESRLGQPINDFERAKAIIAQCDLYTDVLRNLEKMGVSLEDYVNDLKKNGIEDYPIVLARIKKAIKDEEKAKKAPKKKQATEATE